MRILRHLLILISCFAAMLMSFSAIACHMQGHPNRWFFTVAALVAIIFALGILTNKETQ